MIVGGRGETTAATCDFLPSIIRFRFRYTHRYLNSSLLFFSCIFTLFVYCLYAASTIVVLFITYLVYSTFVTVLFCLPPSSDYSRTTCSGPAHGPTTLGAILPVGAYGRAPTGTFRATSPIGFGSCTY